MHAPVLFFLVELEVDIDHGAVFHDLQPEPCLMSAGYGDTGLEHAEGLCYSSGTEGHERVSLGAQVLYQVLTRLGLPEVREPHELWFVGLLLVLDGEDEIEGPLAVVVAVELLPLPEP